MDEVSRRQGRTVLFVSHNMATLATVCPLAIWLEQGSIRQRGTAREVVAAYLVHRVPSQDRVVKLAALPRSYADGDRVRLESIEWLCDLPLRHGEPVKARIYLNATAPVVDVSVGIGFSSLEGGRRLLSYKTQS